MANYVDITIRVPKAEEDAWMERISDWTSGSLYDNEGNELHAELIKVKNVPTFSTEVVREALSAVKDAIATGTAIAQTIKDL